MSDSVFTDLNNEHKDDNTDRKQPELQDKTSLNAFRSLLNYNVFADEKLTDDTYRHARPYNLVLMSTKTLWIVYLLFYGVLIASTIWSFAQTYFTNDTLHIPQANILLLNNNKSLKDAGYDPLNDVFNNKPYNDGIINKSIANLYFDNSLFYPYEIYIYLYGNFQLNTNKI
eukprot:496606_1